MGTYSIKELEILSGIKAHTLRAWEKRYNVINPKRTSTNIRYYNDDDLKRILNIAVLYGNGEKISRVAELSDQEIQDRVLSLTQENFQPNIQIDGLISATIEMDEHRCDKILSKNIIQYGLERTMIDVVFPFLYRVGLLWQTGTIHPAQEHLISNLVRQKIIVAIDGLKPVKSDSRENKYMIFLPDGEQHEIGLLFTYYVLRARKKQVIFLGSSMPFEDLQFVYNIHQPAYLFTICTTAINKEALENRLQMIGERFKEAELLISGEQVIAREKQIKLPPNARIIHSVEELIDMLDHPQ